MATSQHTDVCTSKVDQIEARMQDLCDAALVCAAALQRARKHRVGAAGLPVQGCLPNLPCCLASHKEARHIFHCMTMIFWPLTGRAHKCYMMGLHSITYSSKLYLPMSCHSVQRQCCIFIQMSTCTRLDSTHLPALCLLVMLPSCSSDTSSCQSLECNEVSASPCELLSIATDL